MTPRHGSTRRTTWAPPSRPLLRLKLIVGLTGGLGRKSRHRDLFCDRRLRCGLFAAIRLGEGRGSFALRDLFTIVVTNDRRYICLGLAIRRHAAILLHSQRTRIVGSQRLDHIKVVTL